MFSGNDKCFINICTNEILGKPKSHPTTQGNAKGMQWTIPHSVSQGREDVDRVGLFLALKISVTTNDFIGWK